MVALLFALLKETSTAAVKLFRGSSQPEATAVRDTSAIAASLVVLVGKNPGNNLLPDFGGSVRNLLYLLQHAPAEQCSDFAALLSILQQGKSSESSIHNVKL